MLLSGGITIATMVVATAGFGLSPEQRLRADRLISVFENGKIEFQYDYVAYLCDGRGFNFGRSGFTTGTGDGYKLVKRLTKRWPENPLAPYLDRLKKLAADKSGSVDELNGFCKAVKKAARDERFKKEQDLWQDELYQESAKFADELGLKTALARTAVYDTLLMHGGGQDGDGLPSLLGKTKKKVCGTPLTGVSETEWLVAFLQIRRDDLENPVNEDTKLTKRKKAWPVDEFPLLSWNPCADGKGGEVVIGQEAFTGQIPVGIEVGLLAAHVRLEQEIALSHRLLLAGVGRGLVGGTPGSHQLFGGLVELPCRRAKEFSPAIEGPVEPPWCFVDDAVNPRVTEPTAGGEEPGIGRQHTANPLSQLEPGRLAKLDLAHGVFLQ